MNENVNLDKYRKRGERQYKSSVLQCGLEIVQVFTYKGLLYAVCHPVFLLIWIF